MSSHKHRRKDTICPNCQTPLTAEANYCPTCGQENHDLKLPFWHFVYEVIESITHFDTKLWNTVKAIFTFPGKMTKEFIEGKRARYVPPVRLYIFVAFVFFFWLNNVSSNSLHDKYHEITHEKVKAKELFSEKNEKKISIKINFNEDDGNIGSRIAKDILAREYSSEDVLNDMNIAYGDTLRALLDTLPESIQKQKLFFIQKQLAQDSIHTKEVEEIGTELRKFFTEKIGNKKTGAEYSLNVHALKDNNTINVRYSADTLITIKGSKGNVKNMDLYNKILAMNDADLDNYIEHVEKADKSKKWLPTSFGKWFPRQIYRNNIKVSKAFKENPEEASHNLLHLFIGVFSAMMFFLIPVVAGILKIIYSQRTHWILRHPFLAIKLFIEIILVKLKIKKTEITTIPEYHNRKDWYYYEHLILSIHSHSIVFLITPIAWFIMTLLHCNYDTKFMVLFFFGFIYFLISLKTVYQQGWLKTIFKSFLLMAMYSVAVFSVGIIVLVIKFALFS